MTTISPIGTVSTHVTGYVCNNTPVQGNHPHTAPFNPVPKDIMTPEEVCEYLCIDADTLSAMVRGYQIPVVRLKKGLHRFSRRQIKAWLDEKAQKCNDDE